MNTLHLFAGIGGGIVADMMMGHKPVGAVELDPFCRRVLRQRQADGWLPEFPIFNDVKEFIGDEIKKRVDCISGGFPCQSFSIAGNGKGFDDPRGQLFFDLIRIIDRIRPPFVFLENSPAIISRGMGTVLGEISKIGYHAAWLCLSAADCGAWHIRKRWWCLCWRDGADTDRLRKQQSQGNFKESRGRVGDIRQEISDSQSRRMWATPTASDATRGGRITPNMDSMSLVQQMNTPEFWPTPTVQDAKNNGSPSQYERNTVPLNAAVMQRQQWPTPSASEHKYRLQGDSQQSKCINAPMNGKLNPDWVEWLMGFPTGWTNPAPLVSIEAHHPDFWAVEPPIPRLTDVKTNRADHVRALGNAQVPICAATAFQMLMQIVSTQAPNQGG